jgi:hypothetical protein
MTQPHSFRHTNLQSARPSARHRVWAFEQLESRQLLAAIAYTPINPVDASPIAQSAQSVPLSAPVSLTSVNLHSKPDATRSIYLDFNGHTTTGTSWNFQYSGGAAIVTPAFNTDSDPSTFSDAEVAYITEVWARVAEDFAPFDVDVTTQDPGSAGLSKTSTGDTAYGTRVVIGGSSLDWLESGVASAAGVGFLNTFTGSTDTPVFVFQTQTHSNAFEAASASSHEVGHALNLDHDGTLSPAREYYSGQGIWSPIMGADYTSLNQWSKGEYASASNTEDDLAIITSHGLSYRTDEAGNTLATTAQVTITSSTSATASGIITKSSDIDFYEFFVGATGQADIRINPAAVGPNLDILASLYDSTGTLIATSNPTGALNAFFNLTLDPGAYYVSIDGTGEGNPLLTGYTDYGSLGQYTLDIGLAAFDTVGPTITSISSITSPTIAPVFSIDVTFSEPIDVSTFTFADLSLTFNGGANLINSFSGLSVSLVSGNTYRISGLTTLTTPSGNFVFSVNPSTITDLAGNAGTGAPATTAWTHDATAPTLSSIEAPASPRATSVSTLTVTFSEAIDLNTFTFADLSLTLNGGANLITAGSGVGVAFLSGSTYLVYGLDALNASDGAYQFTINPTQIRDIAGNAGASTLLASSWTVDSTPPTITSISSVSSPRNTSIPSLVVIFSETIDISTLTFADLSLTLDGGANLLSAGSGIAVTQVTPTSYRIDGLLPFTATPGQYTFAIKAANIADALGNTGSASQSSITWTRLSTAPVLKSAVGPLSALEDQSPASITLTNVFTDPYQDPNNLLFAVQSNSNPGLLTLSITNGVLSFTLAPDASGTATVTLTATNSDLLSVSDTFTLTVTPVNDAPTFTASDPSASDEDSGKRTLTAWATFSPGPANESAQTAVSYTVSNISDPSLFSVAPAISASGTLTYTPAANAFGTVTFQVQVKDSGGTANGGVDASAPQTFTITVNPINDAPTFTASNPPAITEDAGPQTLANWATFNPGPANESAQTATYAVSAISNPALFAVPPAIDASGTLTYTPALNMFGLSTFTVQVTDSGGTAGGGSDTSAFKTFTIAVNSVNDAPSISVSDPPSVTEDSGKATVTGWATFIPGPANESAQTSLGYTVSSISNTGLFAIAPVVAADGTLTYTPAPNAFGTSTFKLQVKDSGGLSNGGVNTSTFYTLTITVTPVNDAPSFTATNPPAANEDAGAQTVSNWATLIPGPLDEAAQTAQGYTVSAISNPSLFLVAPAVDVNGALTYTPAANASGTSTFQVRVKDSGGTADGGSDTSTLQTFTITVNPINDAPSFSASNPPAVNEDAGPQTLSKWATFIPGPSDESGQTSLGSIVSSVSNPSLFSSLPAVDANGTLTYTPAPNAFGTSTFKLQVKDSGGTFGGPNGGSDTSAFQTFTITVNPANDAPIIGSLSLGAPGYAGLDPARFTASNVTDLDSPVSQVAFYHDRNKNGIAEFSELLGAGKTSASTPGTWILDIYTPTAPIGLNTILAVAVDSTALSSAPVSASLLIYRSIESNKALQYTDSRGNTVKISILGGGTLKAYFAQDGSADPLKLTVDGSTTAKSSLSITVTKGKGSTTDQTSIGDILINGGLTSFLAAKVNVTGNLSSTAAVKALTLNDVASLNQQTISLGGTASDKSTLTFGRLSNVLVSSTATLASFKALDWQDSGDAPDTLLAPGIASLTLSGRAANGPLGLSKLNGDLEASINIATAGIIGAKTAPTLTVSIAGSSHGDWNLRAYKLTTATVKADVSDSLWSSDGGFGSITITGAASDLTLISATDITSFKAGRVSSSTLDIAGSLGSLSVIEWIGGSITAAKTGAITTTGRLATTTVTAVPGDFAAKLTVGGLSTLANAKSVASIAIKGSAIGSTDYASDWQIAGGVGAITIGGSASGLRIKTSTKGDAIKGNLGHITSFTVTGIATHSQLDITGNLGAVTLGSAANLTLVASGNITSYTSKGQTALTTLHSQGAVGAVTSINWLGGAISADKLGALTIKGQAATKTLPLISGDLHAQITLTGEGVLGAGLTLTSASILGTLSDSAWRINGNSGAITLGAITDSSVFVGVAPAVDANTLPTLKSQFLKPTATLAAFTVTGKGVATPNTTPTFTNSRIAAGVLTNISLKRVDPSDTDTLGITAATKITTFSRQSGPLPSNLFKVSNKTAPGTYDTVENFRLQLVP